MQSNPPVLESRPAQSRDDKIAILRRAGYAPDRLVAIETEVAPPPVPDDVMSDEEMTDVEMRVAAQEIAEIVAPTLKAALDAL